MKIAVVCSKGGHLTEALQVLPAFKEHDIFFVTNKYSTTVKLKHKKYLIGVIHKNIIKMFFAFFSATKILFKENPTVIFSTGAELAIPFFIMGKIFRKKTIYLESIARVNTRSMTGRIVYPFSDLFLVQWPELEGKYGKKSIYKGGIVE